MLTIRFHLVTKISHFYDQKRSFWGSFQCVRRLECDATFLTLYFGIQSYWQFQMRLTPTPLSSSDESHSVTHLVREKPLFDVLFLILHTLWNLFYPSGAGHHLDARQTEGPCDGGPDPGTGPSHQGNAARPPFHIGSCLSVTLEHWTGSFNRLRFRTRRLRSAIYYLCYPSETKWHPLTVVRYPKKHSYSVGIWP